MDYDIFQLNKVYWRFFFYDFHVLTYSPLPTRRTTLQDYLQRAEEKQHLKDSGTRPQSHPSPWAGTDTPPRRPGSGAGGGGTSGGTGGSAGTSGGTGGSAGTSGVTGGAGGTSGVVGGTTGSGGRAGGSQILLMLLRLRQCCSHLSLTKQVRAV